jgi:AICAR transformylase/IMP cyclohydrolase PurH
MAISLHACYILVGELFPPSFTVPLELKSTLRYGENPHQNAAFYTDKSLSLVGAGGVATAIQHHGKVRFCMALQAVK